MLSDPEKRQVYDQVLRCPSLMCSTPLSMNGSGMHRCATLILLNFSVRHGSMRACTDHCECTSPFSVWELITSRVMCSMEKLACLEREAQVDLVVGACTFSSR